MQMLYLSRKDIESLGVGMEEVLVAVDEGFRLKGLGRVEMPPKIGIHPARDSFIHAMPVSVKDLGAAGMKWVSGFPGNIENGLPYISGLLILNDPNTGIPLAVMDCTWITAMRTGASVGVSAKYLARSGASVAAFLGCGVQARTSLAALIVALPQLRDVRCHDLHATARFIVEMGARFPSLKFTACASPTDVAHGADVLVTAIPIVTHPEPPLDADMLKEGGLAVSLDYDSAWTSRAMRQCKFVTDDLEQLQYTKAHGAYFAGIPQVVHADLGELAARKKVGRESAHERIFSMNMGIAVDDVVTAILLYRRAIERSVGVQFDL